MAKLKIVSNNIVGSATVTASTTSGVFSSSNTKNITKAKVWRSTAKTATLTLDFATTHEVDCVILPYTNLVAGASIVVLMYSGETLVHSSGTQYPCKWSLVGTPALEGIPSGVGTYAYGGGSSATYWLPTSVSGVSKVVIQIDNSQSTESYIEVSSIVIGKSWAPKYNTSYGAIVEFKDLSTSSRSDAGDLVVTRSTRSKSVEFDLAYMDKSDKQELTNILRKCGSSYPVFISVYPFDLDSNLEGLYQIYGILSPSSLTNVNFGLFSSQITIEEV